MTTEATKMTRPMGRTRRIAFSVVAGTAALLTLLLTVGSVATLLSPGSSDGVRLATLPHVPWLALGWCAAFGAMVRGAARRPAAMQQLLAMLACLYVGALIPPREDDPVFYVGFGVVVGLLVLLHPTRAAVVRPGPRGVSPALLVMSLVASGPLVLHATQVMGLMEGAGPGDPFYTGIAATALAVPLVGLSASLRAPGFRLPGWSAGAMLASLGAGSLLFGGPGALGDVAALLALLGAVAFVAAVEREAGARGDHGAEGASVSS